MPIRTNMLDNFLESDKKKAYPINARIAKTFHCYHKEHHKNPKHSVHLIARNWLEACEPAAMVNGFSEILNEFAGQHRPLPRLRVSLEWFFTSESKGIHSLTRLIKEAGIAFDQFCIVVKGNLDRQKSILTRHLRGLDFNISYEECLKEKRTVSFDELFQSGMTAIDVTSLCAGREIEADTLQLYFAAAKDAGLHIKMNASDLKQAKQWFEQGADIVEVPIPNDK